MDSSLKILVIEDHDTLREVVLETLVNQGHQVTGVDSAEAVESLAATDDYDLVVLDLQLPGEDGLSLAQRLRQTKPNIGIIMMTARGLTKDKIAGYTSGADLYLTKPVQLEELCAATLAVGRRVKNQEPASVAVLNMQRMVLTDTNGNDIALSPQESRTLSALILAPGKRLENWQLIELLGKSLEAYTKAALEIHIVRLRKKLSLVSEIPAHVTPIQAVRGWGYQLCVQIILE
ncbi:response regulator transcription factor [Herbaspirillum sp. AP02]|uniref:response regulator transcription factor n=1 Tax=unclassified Herbaspirillum TaxID=2624150 RepID=UPI0018C9C881|nr:response regulator transcription factor [Herbaspirillum sp. AP02]MBG7618072.1 response regulator transcription factor [Herbaspirillum sp. AP02]